MVADFHCPPVKLTLEERPGKGVGGLNSARCREVVCGRVFRSPDWPPALRAVQNELGPDRPSSTSQALGLQGLSTTATTSRAWALGPLQVLTQVGQPCPPSSLGLLTHTSCGCATDARSGGFCQSLSDLGRETRPKAPHYHIATVKRAGDGEVPHRHLSCFDLGCQEAQFISSYLMAISKSEIRWF